MAEDHPTGGGIDQSTRVRDVKEHRVIFRSTAVFIAGLPHSNRLKSAERKARHSGIHLARASKSVSVSVCGVPLRHIITRAGFLLAHVQIAAHL